MKKQQLHFVFISMFLVFAVISCKKSATVIPGTPSTPGTWKKMASFPGLGRWGAFGFSIGAKGYIGGGMRLIEPGLSYSEGLNDFWEYDTATNNWTQKANIPTAPIGIRKEVLGFSIGAKGYAGLGFLDSGAHGSGARDFWEYDPGTDSWTRKADFPGSTFIYAAQGFSIGSKGYITADTLYNSNLNNSVFLWAYDPVANKWSQKANLPVKPYGFGSFSNGSKGYIGYTDNDVLYLWEYAPDADMWTEKNTLQEPLGIEKGFSIGMKVYFPVLIGLPNTTSIWEFDPDTNIWTRKANYPGNFVDVSFSVGTKGYAGLGGGNGDVYYNDFWEFQP